MKTIKVLSEDQLNALEASQKINNELSDKVGWDSENLPHISVTICSCYLFITINIGNCEFEIYNSAQEESRIFYEKSNKYEEFYSFIKRRFREIKEELNQIRL